MITRCTEEQDIEHSGRQTLKASSLDFGSICHTAAGRHNSWPHGVRMLSWTALTMTPCTEESYTVQGRNGL